MSDTSVREAERRAGRETTPGGVQGKRYDEGGAVAVADRMNVSLAAKGQKGFIPPKQNPGEDAASYSKRVADAREAWRQKQAMR